ncbi:hypothetical protein [Novosphingobium sp.]|uniref:hypothetical protein n=1 Tax=Novosphingobium sp. TaxID=1874826 RepID=UPI003B528EE3
MQPIPRFHDGNVTGLRLRDGAATIYLRDVSGSDFELLLEGLEALHVEDFREGNIILVAEVVTGRAPDADTDFDSLFTPPHPSADAKYHDAHALQLKRQIARIESGEVSLVMIVPSYGADLLATCREVICRPA